MTDLSDPDHRIQLLLEQFDLHRIYADHYHGHVDQGEGRLFGGLVLAQAFVAAARTDVNCDVHSMHGYFLRPGKPDDVIYGVERLRDGRTFTTRRVTAVQGTEVIFEATVEFAVREPGLAHQKAPPRIAGPDGLPSWIEMPVGRPPNPRELERRSKMPMDVRVAEHGFRPEGPAGIPYRAAWMRTIAPLPEDPVIHAAALAYATDMGLFTTVSTAYRMHERPEVTSGASLDHAIWFHQPPRFDGWMLFETESPAAHSARALYWGGMWNESGERVLSVAQEGLFRGFQPTA